MSDELALREQFQKDFLELVAKDDERVAALTPRQPAAIEDMLTLPTQ